MIGDRYWTLPFICTVPAENIFYEWSWFCNSGTVGEMVLAVNGCLQLSCHTNRN